MYNKIVLALTEGDKEAANQYTDKLITLLREQSWSEARIKNWLGDINKEGGLPEKAEEYYRQALALEPESPVRLRILAYFLIDTERNINEGMELVEKYLEARPVNYLILDIKGWGLFKLGRYYEALELLQKSWNLLTEQSGYNHQVWLHLEAAKKAVAGMK